MKDVVVFKKVCPNCRKEFETTVRHQKYCSSECCAKANSRKSSRRREYSKAQEEHRLVSRAYALSREIAKKYCPLPEGYTEKDFEKLEIHHMDCNPFNCTPTNMMWVTKEEHSKIHSKLVDVNIYKFLDLADQKGSDSEMVKVTENYKNELSKFTDIHSVKHPVRLDGHEVMELVGKQNED